MALPAFRPMSAAPAASAAISFNALKTLCGNSTVRELCLPIGLDHDALRQLDDLVTNRVRLKKGEVLYRAGDSFTALYAIRTGSCKTTVLAEDGREQVAGYHMLGDLIGMDGIGTERHGCQAVALEATESCLLPFDELGDLTRSVAPLQRNL